MLKRFRKWHGKWWWLTSLPTGAVGVAAAWLYFGIGVPATTGYVDGKIVSVKISLLLSRDGTADLLEWRAKETLERLRGDASKTQDAIATRLLNRQIEEENGRLAQYKRRRENIMVELKQLGWRED